MDLTIPIIAGVAAILVLALWKSGILSKKRLKAWIDRQPIECNYGQMEQIRKSVEMGDLSILNRLKGEKPKSDYLPGPEMIPVFTIEKNGEEFRFDMWNATEPGVVSNSDRGRAADLGLACPKTFVIFGKTYRGFIVEGDRGVGLTLDGRVLKLTTTAAEAWEFLMSAKLRSFLTENLTGRQIALYLILGIIIGQMIFFFLKI